MPTIHIDFLGHSILNGCKSNTERFDYKSIESPQWSTTYTTNLAKMLNPALVSVLSTTLDRVFADLPINLKSEELDNYQCIDTHVTAHNGMRTVGYSTSETNVNGALAFLTTLNNQTHQADTLVTHIGVNDLRNDHMQTKAILKGMQHLSTLKPLQAEGTEDVAAAAAWPTDIAILATRAYLTSEGFSDAAIDLFEHRTRHGTDFDLLKMSMQIFNMNIRLGHGKAYYQISFALKDKLVAKLKTLIGENENSDEIRTQLEDLLQANCFATDGALRAMQAFYDDEIKPSNANAEVESLFAQFTLLYALWNKHPAEHSAAEYLAQGEIETALSTMAEHGWPLAADLLSQVESGALSLMQTVDEITRHAAPVCEHSKTHYCHMINPEFYNAFSIFPEDIHETGAPLLASIWSEIAASFPNTFTFDLGKFTATAEAGASQHADGIHWTAENYAEVNLPIASAVTSMMYGVSQNQLDNLAGAEGEAYDINPNEVIQNLVNELTESGFSLIPTCDVVTKFIDNYIATLPLDDEARELIASKVDKARRSSALSMNARACSPVFFPAANDGAADASQAVESGVVSTVQVTQASGRG